MARGFAYLEVNQSTRSLRGTTRNSGLNFLGNRCWTEFMLQANGAQKTKNGDLRRQTSSRLAYKLPRSLAAKLISARDPALGESAVLQLHSRPDSLAARGGYAGSLDCSSRSVATRRLLPHPLPTPHVRKESSRLPRRGTSTEDRLASPRETEPGPSHPRSFCSRSPEGRVCTPGGLLQGEPLRGHLAVVAGSPPPATAWLAPGGPWWA